ncbi:EAL domain-containing protein [Thermodesulfobacteriota bacterium]
MTLYRQLIIFTSVLFFLLFSGSWFAKLEGTRSFLIDQLESHAQDTATSLGLSVSQHANDMPIIESMINAVFDRGYYRIVRFTDMEDNVLIDRILEVTIQNVPQWFIRWVPLEIPEASANVMSGWSRVGSIYVKSHPGYAYRTLWEDVVRMTIWFMGCGVFVLIAGGIGLRVLLRPLVLVEKQADALCRKEYETQERIPWTKELRRVVEAMNRMTSKVKEMFEEQVAQAEGLRERAYHDPLTDLGNRRYFATQITARLDRRDSATKGIVLLIQVHQLEQLNRQKGFQAGDDLLKRMAALLQESMEAFAGCVLARLTGGDFGVFLPDAPPWDAENIAADLANKLSRLSEEQITLTDNVGHVGASAYDCSTTMSRLLSEADLALRTAIDTGPNAWSVRLISEESDKMPLGQQHWKEILEKALKDRRITLYAQSVVQTTDTSLVLHLEILSRIVQEDGQLLSAGVFLPFAKQLKLASALDRCVIEEVMQLDRSRLGVEKIAVNVSSASLQDESFLQWIDSFLQNLPVEAPGVIFEFPEFGAIQNLDLVKAFGTLVRKHGQSIALDHYGQSFSHLGYLKSLRPDYVKIDRAYTGQINDDEENDSRFFVGSLRGVAHSIDIVVIAEGVETKEQLQILKDLNIDGIQGYLIGRPKPIEK